MSETQTIEITGQFEVDRETWAGMTLDERAEAAHEAAQQMQSWALTYEEFGTAAPVA